MDTFFRKYSHLDLSRFIAEETAEPVGGGSFADVFKASLRGTEVMQIDNSEVSRDNSIVAMKRFRMHLSGMGNMEKMVAHEFGLWSKLRHDNILPLIGYCRYDNALTMVSPWMEGGSILDYWIKHEGEAGARPFIDIVVDIANGLEYLHSQEVVHCDLKCANILSTPTGVPRLADFGISRLTTTQHTSTSQSIRGTLRWMAVELVYSPQPDFASKVASNEDVPLPMTTHTKMSDVWAFGMIVLELWTKQHPYNHIPANAETLILIEMSQGGLPRPPIELATAHQDQVAMWGLCLSCWNQSPVERPDISSILGALRYLRENQHKPTVVSDMKAMLSTRTRPGPQLVPVSVTHAQQIPKANSSSPGNKQSDEDHGGADGDGAGGAGAGGGLGAGAFGGGTAAAVAAESVGGDLLATALDLFGSVYGPSYPSPPTRPPGPDASPSTPFVQGTIGQSLHGALQKDFMRWKKCTQYRQTIETALACALEYRTAISLLREVLQSDQGRVISRLRHKDYEEYKMCLALLIHDFSLLSRQFAEQWLDMTECEISMTAHSPSANGRKLDISWTPLRLEGPVITAVTVQIKGEPEPRLRLKSFGRESSATVDIPSFSFNKGLKIVVQVSSLAAVWGGEPKYMFFSQGKPTFATVEELPPSVTTLNFYEHFPDFQELPGDDAMITTGDTDNIPVFVLGSHRYWPLKFRDNRVSVGLVAQNIGTLEEVKRWERYGDRYINKIVIGRSTVNFIGQYARGAKFTMKELYIPDLGYNSYENVNNFD